MAEEVNYASVVFKSHKKPPEGSSEAAPPKKIEETIYDEVKVQSNGTEQPADANVSAELLPDKEANSGFGRLQQLLCCLGILCVLLLSGLIGLCVHVALSRDQRKLSQLRETNDKLRSDNTNLEGNITNLTVQLDEVIGNNTDLKIQNTNLTVQLDEVMGNYTDLKIQTTDLTVQLDEVMGNYTDLKIQTTDLTVQLDEVMGNYTDLKIQTTDLTVQLDEVMGNYTDLKIQTTDLTVQLDEVMGNNTDLKIQNSNLSTQNQALVTQQRNWNKLNVSRAQWSVDNYCPKKKNKRSCEACQDGWENTEPFCYAINNPESDDEQKTWEEAREDCRGKSADLAVVNNIEEKNTIRYYSWGPEGSQYWLGLKVEDGQWKWVDGTDLSRSYWIDDPVPGHCAVSVHNTLKWRSVRCDEKNRWICRKDALSV